MKLYIWHRIFSNLPPTASPGLLPSPRLWALWCDARRRRRWWWRGWRGSSPGLLRPGWAWDVVFILMRPGCFFAWFDFFALFDLFAWFDFFVCLPGSYLQLMIVGKGGLRPGAFQLQEYQYREGRSDINKLPAPPPRVKLMTEVTSMTWGTMVLGHLIL